MMTTTRITTVAVLLALAACSSNDDATPAADPVGTPDGSVADGGPDGVSPDAAPSEDGSDESPAEAGPADLDWKACGGGFSGACASVPVPLDWDDPAGPTLDIYIDLVASSNQHRAQVWLLQGGPGGSGADMVDLGRQLAQDLGDCDVFTLDHRGVNRSARLACPVDPVLPDGPVPDGGTLGDLVADSWQPCIESLQAEWGAGLDEFNASNAARDLAHVIDRTRLPGQEVYIYGVSYGTYWAQRYLQLFPSQAAGVVLDSVVAMDTQVLSDWDHSAQTGIQQLAEACKSDATCRSKLGDDPWARLESIAQLARNGHCPDVDPQFRSILAGLFQSNVTSPYAFAAMYRYERCEPDDVAAVHALLELAQTLGGSATFSVPLFNHVAYSEIWEVPPPSYEQLLARSETTVFPWGTELQATLGQRWPVYPHDQYVRKYPDAQIPVLILNGTLDVQTPIDLASGVEQHYTKPHQTFVTFPYGNHGATMQTLTTDGRMCGLDVTVSFLRDPTKPVDTTCLAKVSKPDFVGVAANNEALLGVADMWENSGATLLHGGRGALPPALLRELERVRRFRLRAPVTNW